MTASFTVTRELALGALWWVCDGATFYASLADTTGAGTPPALTDDYDEWLPYLLAESFDVFVTAGSTSYDTTITSRSKIPALTFTLNYASTVTFTDLVIYCVPNKTIPASAPVQVIPFVGVIHEPTPFTLNAGTTKTYNLNLYSEPI